MWVGGWRRWWRRRREEGVDVSLESNSWCWLRGGEGAEERGARIMNVAARPELRAQPLFFKYDYTIAIFPASDFLLSTTQKTQNAS